MAIDSSVCFLFCFDQAQFFYLGLARYSFVLLEFFSVFPFRLFITRLFFCWKLTDILKWYVGTYGTGRFEDSWLILVVVCAG